eukprot:gene8646-593_t
MKKVKNFYKLSSQFRQLSTKTPKTQVLPKIKERVKKQLYTEDELPKITLSKLPDIHDIITGNSQCIGCGSLFQNDDEQLPGFIHEEAIESYRKKKETELKVKEILKQQQDIIKRREQDTNNTEKDLVLDYNDLRDYERAISDKPLVCLRCHQLSSYGKMISCDISADDFYSSLEKLKDKKVLIVKIIDLFDVEGSFIPRFNELVGDNPILLIGNKVDLLPKNVVYPRVETWLKEVAKSFKLHNIKSIHLVSGAKGINIKSFGAKLEKFRHFRDVYIVGRSNVGKSTLINRLISAFHITEEKPEDYENRPHIKAIRRLTESSLPGTTLKTMSFRIGKGYKKASSYLFDTPGVMNPNLASNYLSPSEWKFAYPAKKIVAKHYRMKPGRTLFIGGMFRIDFVSNNIREDWQRIMVSLFVSTYIPIHTTKTEKADEIYKSGLGRFLYPPQPENENLTPMVFKKSFRFTGVTRKISFRDICISGMGWISLTGVGDMEFHVYAPEKIDVYDRAPLMPNEVVDIKKTEFRDA